MHQGGLPTLVHIGIYLTKIGKTEIKKKKMNTTPFVIKVNVEEKENQVEKQDLTEGLEDAKKALKAYQKTINGKLAAGHSLESATESAQLEIQQQEEAIVNAQTVADAQAEAIILKPKQDMTKLAIIGGVAIVGLIAFLRFRK